MAQNIEIPVSLGLQNAQAQITELRKILQDSVNVKSDAFRDIQRFLDKISGQADTLKGKMGEAFKTPNGSKNFLKQYEQLMGMLEAAKDRFTNLGLNDIAFSSEDQTSVNNMLEKIKNLQAEIANLEKGKIGNLFNDKSIQGADQVTTFIEQLKNAGQDVSKLTFSGLSAAINKELTQVNTSIQQTTEKINNFKQQISILSGASLDNITTKMEQALTSSIDSSKFTFKTENLIEYRNAIAEFYKKWDQLGIQHNNKNDATGNISTWLQRESQNIANGAENLKAQLPKCQAALQQLQDIKNDPALKGDEAKRQIQNIAETLGLTDFKADSFQKYTSAITELRRRINEEIMPVFTSDKDIDNYAQKMIENLGQVFNNIDINTAINTTNLRNQLKTIFTESGLDIKDSDLSRIFNSIGENIDFSTFLVNAKQAFQDFVKNRQEMVDAGEKQNEDLKKQQADLQAANNTVQIQDNIKTDSIKQKEAEIQQFTQSLQELINKYNQANGTHLRVIDDSQFKNGQSAINSYIDSLTKLQQKQKALSNVQMAVNRWMGFWQVLNMTKSAINEMKQHIQELDTVMTSISVVTNFSQEDLWGQISQYSEIARQYGVAIKGVYEVSQIYYQQGLQQNDVMTLTTETLKMARIAGLDYATAADYMTTAIRGFKLEMTDAAHVTDVFSALAATTASSTEEIAVAISKTAASAEAVGASFEATSAMMATMIATTRESATNIGTALKSVISRYGEMTSDPSKTVDSEGEEMSLNRVDKALQTVGITIHDTAGQFRDFDDVMLELMEKWDSLDSLSQRYIATLMAGNRQQSRFLALVSNVDEYKKALQTAMNSEGTGELQTLKTLDSIDAKIEKMKVTIQEFYTSSGLEEMYKGILDTITNVISAANDMPKIFGKIPVQALAVAASLIMVIKNALRTIIANIQASLKQAGAEATSTTLTTAQSLVLILSQKGAEAGKTFWERFTASGNAKVLISKVGQIVGQAISLAGSSLIISGADQYGKSTSIDQDKTAGRKTIGGAVLSIGGSALSGAAAGAAIGAAGGPIGAGVGAIAGALEGLISNFPALITGIDQWNVSLERSIELAQKNAQEQKTNAQRVEGEFKSLNSAVEKYKELRASQYDSAEAAQEFQAHVNTLADSYPALISRMDETGNYTIELEDLERALAAAREQTAIATAQATQAELASKKEEQNGYQELYDQLKQRRGFDPSNFQSQIEQYKTNINTPDKLLQNLSYNEDFYGYLHQFGIGHDWASLLQSYNDGVESSQRFTFDGSEEQAKQIITDNYDAIVDYYSQLVYRMKSYDDYYTTHDLKSTIESLQKIDPTLSLEYLTGIGGLTDLNDIKPTQIFYAIDHLQEVIQDRIANYGNIINNIADELVANRSQIAISKEATKDITNQFDYGKHGKLISALVSQNPWLQEWAAIDTEESDQFETLTDQKTQEYLNYFKSRQQGLEYLENDLKLEEFNSWDEVKKVLSQYGQIDDSDVGKEIRDVYEGQWTDQRKEIVALYSNQLKNIFGKDTNIRDFLDINVNEETGLDNSNFTGATLTAIQSDLKQYQSFIEKQQYAQAEAYLDNMEAIYGPDGIGSLSGEEQTKVFDVIKDLDLSDPEQLRAAAETFTNMGGKFETIASNFTDAANRYIGNASLIIEQILDGTTETTKALETAFDNRSKAVKMSEAMKNASELLANYTGEDKDTLTWESLYDYSESAKGYIENQKAFEIRIKNATEENARRLGEARKAYSLENTVFEKVGLREEKNGGTFLDNLAEYHGLDRKTEDGTIISEKDYFGEVTGLTGNDLDAAYVQFEQILLDYKSSADNLSMSFSEYYKKRIDNDSTAITKAEQNNEQIIKQLAQDQIKNFDFTSIVNNTSTEQSKSNLKELLKIAGANAEELEKGFGDAFAELAKGNINAWNDFITKLGLDGSIKISTTDAGNLIRTEYNQYATALEEVLAKKPYEALSDTTRGLIGASKDYTTISADVITAAKGYVESIWELYNQGKASLEEAQDALIKLMDAADKENGRGRQKEVLDAAKDGFSNEDMVKLGLINQVIDEETGKVTGFEYSSLVGQYLERDTLNGGWKARAGYSMQQVLTALNEAYGFAIDQNSKEWKDFIKSDTDQLIATNEANNVDQQLKAALGSIFSGKEGDQINISSISDEAKQKLIEAGYNVSGKILTIGTEQAMNQAALALSQIDPNFWTNYSLSKKDLDTQIRTLNSKMAKNTAFEGIVGEQFNQSAAEALSMALQNTTEYSKVQSLMTEMGFKWDQAAQVWKTSAESIKAARQKIAVSYGRGEIDTEEYLNLAAQLNETANAIDPKTKKDNAILEMLQNYTNASEAIRAAFLTQFNSEIYAAGLNIDSIFKANDNGTYDIDVGALKSFLDSIGFEYDEAAMSQIQTITDSYLNNIKTATTYTTQGASSLADVDAFKQSYADIVGKTLSDDAFSYNSVLQSFVLDESYMDEYINAQREKLRQLNYSEEFIEQYIKDQTDRAIQDSIELDGFLNATTSTERNDEANKLIQQIRGLSNYKDLFTQDSSLIQKLKDHHFDQESFSRDWEQYQEQYDLLILETLESGGQDAVNLLKQIKPDASSDELEAAFNSQINKLTDVLGQVEDLVAGEFVGTEGKLYEVLARAGAVDDNGVVKAGFDMVEVYAAIYAEMTQTAGATIAGLNDAYAQLLTAQDQTNIDITEALKNGNGMSYADFGNLLVKYDIKFEDYMTQHYDAVMRDGFGNIRITDWNAFAKSIWGDNLDQVKNTQEYTSAFKAYNDGLIELNKNTEDAIVEEIKQIESAKTGDWLNLSEFGTQYYNALKKSTNINDYLDKGYGFGLAAGMADSAKKDNAKIFDNLNAQLHQWGASFEDGILKIGEKSNLLGIAQTLEQAAVNAGLEIGNGLEEVKDAVLNILKSYVEAITKGISGGLTNTEMSDLITKAKDFGVTDLQFNETADGFQLAETSAIKLYQALKSIDSLHAEEAFNALSESLEKTNENFKTTSALMAHIAKINSATGYADDNISDARKKQYQEELEIAQEILAVRSTTEDDSFNFMDQKIPSGQNNPLNYWKGWEKAFDAINASKKSKRMDYTDFYNLMTEMGHLSDMMGGKGIQIGKKLVVDSQNYTDLITEAGKNLTTTAKDTSLKVNLPAIDVDFSAAENMVDNIDAGIQKVAQDQIDMLDGLIALLETIVAMEKLNDIVKGGKDDNKIDLGDIIPEITWDENGKPIIPKEGLKYAEDYEKFCQDLIDQCRTNKNLEESLQSIKLGDFSLYQLFDTKNMTAEKFASMGEDYAKGYAALLEGFRKASISGNYDVDNIMASVKEVLAESGINDLTIDTGKSTMIIKGGIITTVDWEDPDVNEVIKEITHKEKASEKEILAAQEKIKKAMEAYLAGKGTGDLELEHVLKVNHRIKVDSNTNQEYVMVGPNRYNVNDPNWKGALAAQQLLDMGIDSKDITVESNQAIVSNYTIGNQTNIKIISKDGYTEFSGVGAYGETITGTNEQDWLKNYITSFRKHAREQGDHKEAKWTDNEILWRTLNIHVNTKSQIIDKEGKSQDLTHDAETRKYLNDAKNNLTDNLTEYMDNEGNVEIPLKNGLTWKISGEKIDLKTDGSYNSQKLNALFSETLGIDESLKDTISQAITNSLTALPQAINSIEPSNITSVSEALSGITTALAAVVGDTNWDTLIAKLQEVASAASGIKLPTGNGNDKSKTPAPSNKRKFPAPWDLPAFGSTNGAPYRSSEDTQTDQEEVEQRIDDLINKANTALTAGKQTLTTTGASTGVAMTESFVSAVTNGLNTLSEGITEAVESVDHAYTDLKAKTEEVAGTIRSHWEALVNQITSAVSLIQSLVQSLQEKISITWTIGSKGGKSDLAGSGSGVNLDPTRGVTALTEYMDKMLSTMEHNKKNDTFKVTMPTLTIDTSTTKVNIDDIGTKVQEEAAKEPVKEVKVSVGTITADLANVNVDVASINEKVKTETKANPIPSLDTLVNSITPDLTGTTVDTAGINKKVQTEITKNPISNLNVAVSAITPDVSEATPADIEVFPKPLIIKSAKAKIEKLADPLDLTEINDLGVQKLNENASMVLTDVKAVPTSLSLSLDSTSQVSIDESTPVVLSKPVKVPVEVDDVALKETVSAAITEVFTSLKTEIENLDTESITTLAKALSTVSSAIDALAKNKGIETFGESIEELKTDNFIAVTTAMDNMAKSLQTLASAADWVTLGVALALLNAALILVSINSTAFDTLKEKIDTLANDANLTTLQNKLQDIVDKLLKIKDNNEIDIKINFDDGGALAKLQQLAKLIDKLTGKDANVNVNTDGKNPPGKNPPGGLLNPKKGNLPLPSYFNLPTPSNPLTPQGTLPSFANGNGPINPNLQNEVLKIKTEFDQPTNTLTPPDPLKVPVEYDSKEAEVPEPDPIKVKVEFELSDIPKPEVPDAIGKVNWETGTAPEVPTIPDAEGTVNWKNGSIPSPPSFSATGYIHWQSAAAGNFVFHRYYNRKNPAADKPGEKKQETVKAKGNAFAGGTPTLMGELGPELVVSKGRYGLVGLNGPEFISLDKDAIVFNHLQTESLMTKGVSKERGRAVTNERNAVAFATGNIDGGPAMASASAALSALKQLRAMWESLRNAKVSDLAGAGGGGGGGGGGNNDKTTTPKEWVALVERWYNLMQEIDKLEKSITHEEKLRSKIQSDFNKNGTHYARSNQRSLEYLQKQIAAQEQLNISRQKYFDTRRESLKDTPLGQIYEFDSQGQMHFKKNLDPSRFNGFTDAMEWRTWITGMEPNGKARYSNKEKYDQLIAAGFEEYMKYDSSGTEIKRGDFEDADEYYATVTKQVFDRIDEYQEATQSLWDNIQEGYDTILELEEARNQILQEMRDNQLELENQILDAIVDMRQREIDTLQEEREKLEETTSRYIEGLTNALDKEQQMYETQQADNDLNQKRRRLSILQRSGGSAEDIANLSREIDEESRDHYFDLQQQQIDAIQEASDQQLQRMDTQIELMTEELEFQKEFGLLWNQVYDVMEMSANQITEFITHGNSEFWSESALGNATKANDILFQAEQWQEQKNDIATIAEDSRARLEDRAYENFNEAMKASYGENYDTNGTYQATFRKTFQETGDITKAGKAAQDAAQQAFMTDQNRLKAQQEGIPYQVSDLSDWWYYVSKNNNVHRAHHYNQGLYTGESRDENHTWDGNGVCIKCGHKKPAPQSSGGGWNWGSSSSSSGSGYKVYWKDGKAYTAKSAKEAAKRAKGDVYTSKADQYEKEKRASGGYVGHGIYELGELGTETVLTAEQTQVLRNNILSNRPNSLISLLKSYNQSYNRDSVYKLLRNASENIQAAMTNNNGVTIENATVNMNVSQIANDYDAKRAGEQALNEMMRIARKTSAGNSLRR